MVVCVRKSVELNTPIEAESVSALPSPPAPAQDVVPLSDYEDLGCQYEEALARINALTLEAEVARLEFDQVFDAVADATLVVGIEGHILRANAAAVSLVGVGRKSDMIGAECRQVLHSELCEGCDCVLARIRKGAGRIEEDVSRSVGERAAVPLLLTATPLLGLSFEVAGGVLQFKDITERKRHEKALIEANRELNRLSSIDALTQIANRRAFDEAVAREWLRMRREKRPMSLIMCDVDFFKRYNDHYGHPAGDVCLKAVAGCIQRCARRPGDLVARFGGEEFVVILPDTPSSGAVHVAEAIRMAVESEALAHVGSSVAGVVTVSVGTATKLPAASTTVDPNRLVAEADEALYRAKSAGRNRVVAAAPDALLP